MGGTGKVSAGTPSRLRTFDPVRLADLEYRAWVGYYLRRFYALVKLTYGEPASPAKAAELEVDWWRVHREGQHGEDLHSIDDQAPAEELVQSLTRLYRYLYREPETSLRPAAVHRARAMDLSDEWIRQGRQPDSRLLPLEHAALVRCYAALLAAVHH
jgi:hypothetical protein